MTEEYKTFNLGDWQLQSGEQIKNAHIAYQTFGDPKSPAIVYPTWFSGGENSPIPGITYRSMMACLKSSPLQRYQTISGS